VTTGLSTGVRVAYGLSDLEVEYEDLDGKLYYIKYPLEDRVHYLTVATTRPETLLGDTAVAVHPMTKDTAIHQ